MGNKSQRKTIPTKDSIQFLRQKLMHWFSKNQRRYPWRKTRDPFRILVAEIMLRRTKADQVKPVYKKFFKEFPDSTSIICADKKKLRKVLFPLGLKWRIPSFQLVARELHAKYNGKVPKSREELLVLSGVGDYVAGAVLSIAYNQKEWIVDSNVVRLFRRYFGAKTSKEGRRDKHIIEIARIFSSGRNPRKANLAILDFSALICVPRNPACRRCSLAASCYYYILHSDRKRSEL